MIKSQLCELLGIRYPLFQGGMAWIADGTLAAAVSEGGGLGIIGAGSAPASWVREQIQIAKALTDKPFGVNIMLMSPFADEIAQVVAEEQVAVVTTGAGNPGKYMELWKAAGIKVIPVVASVALAKRMERLGAAAVIAEGGESGGHVSSLKLCCGRSFDWQAAQRALLQQLESFAADGDAAFGAYSARLLTLGRSVVVHSEGSARRAQALALEASGALRLRWEDSGREELLLSGQVSLRAEQGYL